MMTTIARFSLFGLLLLNSVLLEVTGFVGHEFWRKALNSRRTVAEMQRPSPSLKMVDSSSLPILQEMQTALEPAWTLVQDQPLVAAGVGVVAAGASLSLLSPSSSLVSPPTLNTIVEGTFLQDKPLECVYQATRDGWSALDFHEAVDERGSAVVVVQTFLGNKVFGGHNPAGWRSTDDYVLSSAAFLWCLGSNNNKVVKFPILNSGNAAIFDYATSGPNFGSVDLQIGPPRAAIMGGFAGPDMENVAANAGDLRQAKVTPGFAYQSNNQWPVRGNCRLTQVQVYCAARPNRR